MAGVAVETFCHIESVGALQLSGSEVELRAALQAPDSGQMPGLSRHNATRIAAHKRLVAEPVSCSLALELASTMGSTPVSVRRGDVSEELSSSAYSSFSKWSPPTGSERIQTLLDNWQGFIQKNSGDLDPLIMVAAAHGQWNALQPFTHENIANGQLLSSLLMCEEDLLPAPALPISLYFSRRSERHWKFMYQAVAHGDHGAWIQFFMTAVTEAAVDATEQLMRWEQLKQALAESLRINLPKEPSMALIDVCNRPSFGLAELSDAGLSRRQTASAWMQRLVSEGVLVEMRFGKEKRYINNGVLSLLTR
jgi:Fic family protein